MNSNLHIVTLNIPFPPDYGGMIDTYYRIRSLHNLGIRIHLHCFEYGRKPSKELESLCETTYYYGRKSGLSEHLSSVPYIVSSRRSEILLENLIRDDFPILFDGLHSTFYINHPALSERKRLVRLHNIEHRYYQSLAHYEPNPLKKIYFLLESAKLKRYERVLESADYILPISESDHEYFNLKYDNSLFLAPFHSFCEPESIKGTGDYIIYHGDLSVNENSAVADYLISNVFSRIPYKCIIAGKNPSGLIKSHARRFSNIQVIANPDEEQMAKLISNAQINLLPAFANNGFKLKLLAALYAGRHCLINSAFEASSSVKTLLNVANSGQEIVSKVHQLMKEPFTEAMIQERKKILSVDFDVTKNGRKLINILFGKI